MASQGTSSDGWLDRHPAVVPGLAAAAFFALFQAAFLAWRNQDAGGGPELTFGMLRVGLVAGLLTILILVPAALLLRRLLPAWRRGESRRASRHAFLGPAAALAAWMAVDLWAAGPLVPAILAPWVAATAALAAGFAADWLRPPQRLLRAAAASAPLLLALAFAPVWPEPEAAPQEDPLAAAPPAAAGSPDVVLVSIDTLRADRIGVYGGSSLTPEIDRIAGEGLRFERALATSPWTVPSVASMLTGLPSVRHGAGLALGSGPTFLRSPLGREHTTLAERFRAAGYRTRAVVANGFLVAETGMAQGFEAFENPLQAAVGSIFMRDVPLARLVLSLIPAERWGDYRAQGVTDRGLAWLAEDGEEGEKPLFLWLHYIDPHTPYQADPGELDLDAWMAEVRQKQPQAGADGSVVGEVFAGASHVRGGMLWLDAADKRRVGEYYDRAVRYVDEHVGRLFAALRERGVGRPVIAAVTADHGEELWDHGHFEHGHDYYREVTRVPLVFWGPGTLPAGRTVTALAGLVDVAPTLLELAGLEPPAAAAADEGRSLVTLWDGGPPGEEAPAATPPRFAGGNLYDLPAVLLEDGPWRCILRANGAAELYDAAGDPEERRNLAFEHPEVAERYRQVLSPRLEVFLRGAAGEGAEELSPETIKALKSLGYL